MTPYEIRAFNAGYRAAMGDMEDYAARVSRAVQKEFVTVRWYNFLRRTINRNYHIGLVQAFNACAQFAVDCAIESAQQEAEDAKDV